jgi:hypothetical protein
MESEKFQKEINFKFELRKRKEKMIIDISSEELNNKSEKVLKMLKKESVDLRSWFYVIVNIKLILALLLFYRRLPKF